MSRLHAEIVRRGSHVYVSDLGLSVNGTRVNGRPVGRRVLSRGRRPVLRRRPAPASAASAQRLGDDTLELRRISAPDLTRRELEVLTALCRPALQQDAFVAPSSAHEIAEELVVTEAAVKQHLLRLYQKFRIGEGVNRRARLANEVISAGVVRPLPRRRARTSAAPADRPPRRRYGSRPGAAVAAASRRRTRRSGGRRPLVHVPEVAVVAAPPS